MGAGLIIAVIAGFYFWQRGKVVGAAMLPKPMTEQEQHSQAVTAVVQAIPEAKAIVEAQGTTIEQVVTSPAPLADPVLEVIYDSYATERAAMHRAKIQDLIKQGAPYGQILLYRQISWAYIGNSAYWGSWAELVPAQTREEAIELFLKSGIWNPFGAATREYAASYLDDKMPEFVPVAAPVTTTVAAPRAPISSWVLLTELDWRVTGLWGEKLYQGMVLWENATSKAVVSGFKDLGTYYCKMIPHDYPQFRPGSIIAAAPVPGYTYYGPVREVVNLTTYFK